MGSQPAVARLSLWTGIRSRLQPARAPAPSESLRRLSETGECDRLVLAHAPVLTNRTTIRHIGRVHAPLLFLKSTARKPCGRYP